MFIMKMKVSITLKAGTTTDSATKCGAQILSQMDEFTAKITVENCGNASFLPPSDSQGQAACFPGSAHISPQSCCEWLNFLHIFGGRRGVGEWERSDGVCVCWGWGVGGGIWGITCDSLPFFFFFSF